MPKNIVLFDLAPRSDRRGIICTIECDSEYDARMTAFNVFFMTSLLASHYSNNAERFEKAMEFSGEINDCWIKVRDKNVEVWHKYWAPYDVDAFHLILKGYATANKITTELYTKTT